MISPEERMDLLDDEVESLVEKGWTIVSRTDTTCFLRKENKAMGCLALIYVFLTYLPILDFQNNTRTRTIEIGPDGEIKRSWIQL